MFKHKLLLSGSIAALFLMVLALLCTLPEDPNDPSNTSVGVVVRASKWKVDNNFLEDTAGNPIQIGAAIHLPENVESVNLKIVFGGVVVFDTMFSSFQPNTNDTVWKEIVFYTAGSRTITITPYASIGLSPVSATISIIGKEFPLNHAPTINVAGTTVIKPTEICSLAIQTTDADAGQLRTVTMVGFPVGSQLQKNNTQFVWTAPPGFIGSDTVIFMVKDDGKPPMTDSATVVITVTATPHPPTIEVVGDKSLVPLETCSLTVRVSDSDSGQELKRSISGEPEGSLLVNDSIFVWTAPADFIGEKVVTFTVTDNGFPPLSSSVQAIISVSAVAVNTPPVWDVGTLSVPLNDTAKYVKNLMDICHDIDSDVITFSLSTGLPAGDTIAGTTYTYKAKPTSVGTYQVRIIAADPDGATDTLVIDLSVSSSSVADTIPPTFSLVAPAKDSVTVSTSTYPIDVISSDASGIASVVATLNGTALPLQPASGHYTVTMGGLKAGEYNKIELVATDASPAANKKTQSVYIKYVPVAVDVVKPVLLRVAPAKDSTIINSSSIKISVKATDESGIASVVASLGSTNITVTPSGSEYSADAANLTANLWNTLRFIATDGSANGNKDTLFVTVKYDPTATDNVKPVMKRHTPLADSTAVSSSPLPVSIVAKDASRIASVVCSFGSTAPAVTRVNDSVYTATVSGLVAAQFNTVRFIATDSSSNGNKESLFVTVKYDPTMTDNVKPAMRRSTPAADSTVISSASTSISIVAKDANKIASVACSFGSTVPAVTKDNDSVYTAAVSGLVAAQWNTVRFIATDSSVNGNKETLFVTVKYDPTLTDNIAPTFSKATSNPASGSTVTTAAVSLVYTITDASGVGAVTWALNGGTATALTPATGGVYTIAATLRSPPHANTIVITAQDGSTNRNSGTETVTLNYNLAPAATAPAPVTTPRATAVAILLAGTDPDGDIVSGYTVLTPAATNGPYRGTLSGTAPSLTYTPTGNLEGRDSIMFTVSDGTLTSAPAKVVITVTANNVPPTVTAFTISPSTVPKGTSVTFSATTNYATAFPTAVYRLVRSPYTAATDTIASGTVGSATISYSVPSTYAHQASYKMVVINSAAPPVATTPVDLTVSDVTKPTLTLTGSSDTTIVLGSTWTDPKCVASDDRDGNISARITLAGAPSNTNTVGRYVITYNVSDLSANTAVATVQRTLRIEGWELVTTIPTTEFRNAVMDAAENIYIASDQSIYKVSNGTAEIINTYSNAKQLTVAIGSNRTDVFSYATVTGIIDRYNGTSWTTLGTYSLNSIQPSSINIGPGNSVYLTGGYMIFMRVVQVDFYNGEMSHYVVGDNDPYPPLTLGSGHATTKNFCVTPNSDVFTVGQSEDGTNEVNAARYSSNSGTWTFYPLETTTSSNSYIKVVNNGSSVAYVGYTKADDANPTIYQFSGSSWALLPSVANNPTQGGGGLDIAVSTSGVLHAAYVEGSKVLVKKYVNSTWKNIPDCNITASFTGTAQDPFVLPGTDVCYIVYVNSSSIQIRRWRRQ